LVPIPRNKRLSSDHDKAQPPEEPGSVAEKVTSVSRGVEEFETPDLVEVEIGE
jgi:hypothetical protein